MDIECKLIRPGGTHVRIETTDYHFLPLTDGAHVAAVESAAHQDRFLAIPEAYGVYRGKGKPVGKKAAAAAPQPASDAAPADQTLLGASGYLDGYEFAGKAYAFADIVALTQQASGLDAAAWNALEEDARADLIDEQLDRLAGDTQPDPERTAFVEQYRAKFGKAPHGRWSLDKIREALAQ
jgi:hypothetical protein